MLDALQLPFMQRAAAEIALLAPLAGLLGAQVVLRNLAFFTHSVGAATFPGLVVAGPAGIPPALAALGVGGAFAGLLERLGRRGRVAGDAATAILLVAALAIGIVLASDVFSSGSEVDQLLFGSLLAIGDGELLTAAIVLAACLLAVALARRTWIATGFDEGGGVAPARVAMRADRLLLAALAIAVVASLDAVGALLVSAILVVPAATARLFARSVPALEAGGAGLALVEGLAGLLIAYELDAPPGAVIATLSGCVFGAALLVRWIGAALTRGATA